MRSKLARAAGLIALALGVIAWAMTLRPVTLGGTATYLVVRGSSMLPTYQTGDLLVLRISPAYVVGEAVGYRVPQGQVGAGHVVVHRIVGFGTADGFVMRGDNNAAPDPWTPTAGDVVGVVWLRIPFIGRLLDWLHQPATLAALAASFVAWFLVFRRPSVRAVPMGRARSAEMRPGS